MNYKIQYMDNIPDELLNAGEKKLFKKNEVLHEEGEIPKGMYILLKGIVLVLSEMSNGDIKIHSLFKPLCTILDIYTITSQESNYKFVCYNNVEVIFISNQELTNIMINNYEITKFFFNIASDKINRLSYQLHEYDLFNGEKRIYNVLLEFAKHYGINENNRIRINFKISQQFISNLVGVRRMSTIRTFDKLKAENILEFEDSNYYIKNIDLLKEYVTKIWQKYGEFLNNLRICN